MAPETDTELAQLQSLRALSREMRGAILARDIEAVGRITQAQEAVSTALARETAAGRPPSIEERRLAAEIRAESEANGALLEENLAVIDRLVRTIVRARDAGTYGSAGGAGRPARAAQTSILSRVA